MQLKNNFQIRKDNLKKKKENLIK